MIQVKASRSWIYIKALGKHNPDLPYRAEAGPDGIYKIPNTPYNFTYLSSHNDIENLSQASVAWERSFKEADNKDRRLLMEHLKTHEKESVAKIHAALKDRGVVLWDMLYNHQVISVYLALINNSYGLFLEMGGGKTLGALQVATVRLKMKGTDKVLIVSPANIMRAVWQEEIEAVKRRYNESILTYEVLDGTKEERLYKLQHSDARVFIINYEMLHKMLPQLINRGFNMLIFDESTKIKNPKAKVTIAAHDLAKRSRYNLILTGTPIYNKEMDIHSQMNVIQLSSLFRPLGLSFYAFRSTYFFKPNASRFAPFLIRQDRRADLTRKIYSSAVAYKREECIQLPPLVTQIIPCTMTPEQVRSYNEVKQNVLTEIHGRPVQAQIALTKLLRLAQITAGFTNDVYGKTVHFNETPKIDTVVELVDEIQEKVVIFCRFQETIRMLKEKLGDRAVTFYGESSANEKKKALAGFKKDKQVFIAQIASGGLGLNLQFASYAIFCELDYLHSTYLQAVARIYRTGQQKKCTVYIALCKDSIDQHLYEVIKKKKTNADQILRTVVRRLQTEVPKKEAGGK